jgi:hypothetical protein
VVFGIWVLLLEFIWYLVLARPTERLQSGGRGIWNLLKQVGYFDGCAVWN